MTDEFRELYDNIAGSRPYCGLKVAVLNCWGRLRSGSLIWWRACIVVQADLHVFRHIEALSGAGVDVSFISFEDIRQGGIPEDLDVIINAGDAGTAWSGGDEWLDGTLTAIRDGCTTAGALWA